MAGIRGAVNAICGVAVVLALLSGMHPAGASTAFLRQNALLSIERLSRPALTGEVIVKYRAGPAGRKAARSDAVDGVTKIGRGSARFGLMEVPAASSIEQLIGELESDPGVAYAEPNLYRYASEIPTDPLFGSQWALSNSGQPHPVSGSSTRRSGIPGADIDAPLAWDQEKGEGTIVAILDSGVDVTHEDLASQLWVNEVEMNGTPGLDDDQNGYIDDINGWDFADNDSTLLETGPYEGTEHGTHVAGIVGAAMNNGLGGVGVCPGCKVMVLKVFEPEDTEPPVGKDTMVGDVAPAMKAIDYAIANGADVINGSFGGSLVSSRAERAKIKQAIAAGITMVFAAGNDNSDNDLLVAEDLDDDDVPDLLSPAYPASYDLPGIISVAASNDADQNGYSSACAARLTRSWPCSFTNWGHDSVDLSAPGVDIISSTPGNTYSTFDGTSMAAPHVAGVAALVKAWNPSYSPAQIENAIVNSVDRPSSLRELYALPGPPDIGEFTRTQGRVDAAAALGGSPSTLLPITDGNIRGATPMRGRASGHVAWPHDVNDLYSVRLRRGADYRVVLDGRSNADLDLQIYKPGTKHVWELGGGCLFRGGRCQVQYYDPREGGDVRYRFTARRSGRYFLHVNAWFRAAGGYSLTITKL